MNSLTTLILLHQLLFQGMFFAKNIYLRRKLGQPIRGDNSEATQAILFFVAFIALSVYFSLNPGNWGRLALLPYPVALGLGVLLMLANLVTGLLSLKDLGESWRVGVIEEQQTRLVESGIYRYSRNPYFTAYLLMFAAYTVVLQNWLLLALSFVGFWLVHAMILREEKYLAANHGQTYRAYKQRVPRYLLL